MLTVKTLLMLLVVSTTPRRHLRLAVASEFPERECCDPTADSRGDGKQHVNGIRQHQPDLLLENPPPVVVIVGSSADETETTIQYPQAGAGGDGDDHHRSYDPTDEMTDNNFLQPEFIPELSFDLGYHHPTDVFKANWAPGTKNVPGGGGSTPGLHQGRPANAILNCLLAHQLCVEDGSCTSMMTVIRHICGPETVACSTTTVTKCQAGLRTLQAFPVFHPTCLCREPALDPDCNVFRDFLFDHPCMVATQKERDMYPFHALPTCTHALEVCLKDASCSRLYGDFREHCKREQGVCRDSETCHNAWRGLRMTPLFGCFCPSSQHKKCERLYSFIYNNSCVEGIPSNDVMHVTNTVPLLRKRLGRSLVTPLVDNPVAPTTMTIRNSFESALFVGTTSHSSVTHSTVPHQHRRHVDDEQLAEPTTNMTGNWESSIREQIQSDSQRIESRLMLGASGWSTAEPTVNGSNSSEMDAVLVDVARISHFVHSAFTHTRINGTKVVPNGNRTHGNLGDESATESSPNANRFMSLYQSTCHRSLNQCKADSQCRRYLDPVLRYCTNGGSGPGSPSCHRDLCMQSLQGFYKDAPLQWSLEVAFCVCKKSENRNDECLMAQERLHPDCARRPERYPLIGSGAGQHQQNNGGHNEASPAYLQTPACHHLADECKAHPDCKPRLEFYVQACAVDVLTKGCAGPPSICRRAVLDILGTDLRTTCSCRAAMQGDLAAMYDCVEWQRLLWLNPCVVEAQRDFHRIQGNLQIVSVPLGSPSPSNFSGSSSTGPSSTYGSTASTYGRTTADVISTRYPPSPRRTSTSSSSTAALDLNTYPSIVTSTSTTTTTETITRPTVPARYCTLERPNKRLVHFPEGTTKRLYMDDDPDCSELCRCGPGQTVTCSIADCAQRKACKTTAAVYAHAATAFQAYRGECLCFSGAFVCAKPDPSQYSLPSGVFLFIGYSKADERSIYQFTHQNASKSLLAGLQRLLYDSFPESEKECWISVHDQIEENIIYQIRMASLDVQRANESVTYEMLSQEKIQCMVAANRLRRMISKRLPEIREDETLSVIKVSDVTSVLPLPVRSGAAATLIATKRPPLMNLFVLVFIIFIVSTRHR